MPSFIEQLSPAVSYFARRTHRRVSRHLSLDDLAQEGWLAAVQAEGRYRNGSGTTLRSFVSKRIMGGMMDYIRGQIQGTPDSQRRNNREPANIVSLDAVPAGLDDDAATVGSQIAVRGFSPEQVAILNERGRILVSAIEELPEQMRRVMLMLYCEELEQKAVAEELGLDPSRISQIHRQAIPQLRTILLERYGREALQF